MLKVSSSVCYRQEHSFCLSECNLSSLFRVLCRSVAEMERYELRLRIPDVTLSFLGKRTLNVVSDR